MMARYPTITGILIQVLNFEATLDEHNKHFCAESADFIEEKWFVESNYLWGKRRNVTNPGICNCLQGAGDSRDQTGEAY
jgi:hypothetical protein